MQFNYQNVKIEEENESDIRKYGLLNKNLVDDEEKLEAFLFKSLQDKLRLTQESNNMLEKLCDDLKNDLQIVSANAAHLENELITTKEKLANLEKAFRIVMEKSMNF